MSDLSVEELLLVIEEAEEKKKRSVKNLDMNSVNRFISDLNIKTGLERIPTYVIFYTYTKKWVNKKKDKKANKVVFFRAFNKEFISTRSNKQRYYLLDPTSFDLTREGIIEAESFDRRLKSGKKEKRKKRKMGQPKKEQESKT
jgi:hypothetical protein